MGKIFWSHIVVLFCLGAFLEPFLCHDDSDEPTSAVYIVTLRQTPSSHHYSEFRVGKGFEHGASERTRFHKPRNISRGHKIFGSHIARVHDSLLKKVLKGEKYLKLYSYHYLINGFAVLVTPQQAEKLASRREVSNVVLDFSVRTATTHTPQFLGLPRGAWSQEGGFETAGEGIVIGFIDTGIDPTHPSFDDSKSERPYPVPAHYSGLCEVTRDFPSGSCNRKLVGGRHFAASAITRGIFNSSQDYASPFDGDGHGTHTASVAAGNHGIPVVVAGHHFGNASGMAPRSHIAVYKALYKSFGGFAADVVAAIDQAAQDGVDVISLSITPNRRPPGVATFLNPIDMALLSAVRTGIFVVQAAGNTGPSPMSMSSFSPWIYTVGAATHDRSYSNSMVLGNNVTIPGVGLASGTDESQMYKLVHALHALKNDSSVADNMYLAECQDSSNFDQELVKGNLLMCSYSIRFVLGLSTIKHALEAAQNLSAVGVVFYMDPFVIGFQLNPVPMKMPGIIISSTNDSEYYNSSLQIDETSKKITKFGAVASICGGLKANYSNAAPSIMYYSARGPDPEDTLPHEADILKPNLVAPGNLIWAAWSSGGTESVEFLGENFAMMSGTSMAAPHVAGLAALIKQKFPNFGPAAVGSALSTTASVYDKNGGPIMAQRSYASPELNQSPATPFDMGSGFVNGSSALNPGLIFDSSYNDYMSFLCGINGSAPMVLNFTGQNCALYNSTVYGPDLNLPSITIAKLNQSRVVQRTVQNVGGNESYSVGWFAPFGVSLKISPTHFYIGSGEKQVLSVSLNATTNSYAASFGRIGLFGNQGHVVNIPVSVIVKISQNLTMANHFSLVLSLLILIFPPFLKVEIQNVSCNFFIHYHVKYLRM
ncbi:subtilisin-like protease SBT2.2 isoform X2 [Prosopis cineraria]|uniref:subtilisin-like protease SBT2.2 isoform X2 n=1 Tax=Prosopis cineraria TaxID=364024 RepID=UPI00240F6C50|nr:subtilisin-like protease SBT2.2 isoform X2 [Prosopis cineraria]